MKVKLVGAPTDLGYMNNVVSLTPRILRDKGLPQMLQDVGLEYQDLGDVPMPRVHENQLGRENAKYEKPIARYSKKLAQTVAESISCDDDFPLIIGGDHSLSIGSIAGIAQRRPNLGVFWIDAHCDTHTPETTRTGWVYGMPAAVNCGLGSPLLTAVGGFSPKIAPSNFCIFGAQYYEPEEIKHIRDLGICLFTITDIIESGLKNCLDKALQIVSEKTDYIHVSFDLDAIDEHDAPGTTESHKGQFTYREITYILQRLSENKKVSSLDVCEYDVSKDIGDKTIKLVIEMIARTLGKQYSEYDKYLSDNAIMNGRQKMIVNC
jgi:arginase